MSTMILKPFSKVEDVSKQRAASEAAPIEIPFQHPDYLGANYSGGKTDKCFFLKAKASGDIYPYNQVMAESGNVHYLPHFDLSLLDTPEMAGTVEVWRTQGVLPPGYGLVAYPKTTPAVVEKQQAQQKPNHKAKPKVETPKQELADETPPVA